MWIVPEEPRLHFLLSTARFTRTNDFDALCDAYTFLGHIHLIEARDAPKIILPNASK